MPVKSRYVELAPWLLVAAAILFLLEVLERRTGWVLRLFGRKAITKTGIEKTELPEKSLAPKPVFPWLVRKPTKVKTAITTAKTRPTATIISAPPENKPISEKPASAASAIDALRQARERAQRRTDKER